MAQLHRSDRHCAEVPRPRAQRPTQALGPAPRRTACHEPGSRARPTVESRSAADWHSGFFGGRTPGGQDFHEPRQAAIRCTGRNRPDQLPPRLRRLGVPGLLDCGRPSGPRDPSRCPHTAGLLRPRGRRPHPPPRGSIAMFLALRQVNVPAELHIYTAGGHGFGLRPSGKPVATWPQRCEEWLRATGVIK